MVTVKKRAEYDARSGWDLSIMLKAAVHGLKILPAFLPGSKYRWAETAPTARERTSGVLTR